MVGGIDVRGGRWRCSGPAAHGGQRPAARGGGVVHGVVVHLATVSSYVTGSMNDAQQLVDRHVAQLASAGVSAIGEVHRELGPGSAAC